MLTGVWKFPRPCVCPAALQCQARVQRVGVEQFGGRRADPVRRCCRPACTWPSRGRWAGVGWVFVSTSTTSSATRSNSAGPKPRVVSAGVPNRMPLVYQAPLGSAGIELRLVTMPESSSARLGLPAGQPERLHVEQHEVVVGAAGDQLGAPAHQAVGEGLGVVDDPLGVGLERRLARLGEGDRLGRHHVRQRTAEHHRAALVDGVGVLRGGQHHAAARAAQRLVGGAW